MGANDGTAQIGTDQQPAMRQLHTLQTSQMVATELIGRICTTSCVCGLQLWPPRRGPSFPPATRPWTHNGAHCAATLNDNRHTACTMLTKFSAGVWHKCRSMQRESVRACQPSRVPAAGKRATGLQPRKHADSRRWLHLLTLLSTCS